jgi:hypothetical protein
MNRSTLENIGFHAQVTQLSRMTYTWGVGPEGGFHTRSVAVERNATLASPPLKLTAGDVLVPLAVCSPHRLFETSRGKPRVASANTVLPERKTSVVPLVSPDTRLLASDSNAIRLAAAAGFRLGPLASPPSAETLTRLK